MNKCLNCQKDIEQTEGRRQRLFCDAVCRVAYHRKKKGLEPRWVDREKYEAALKRIAELEMELSQKPKVQDLTKPTNVVKPPEPPKSNFTINTGKHRLWKEGDPKEGSGGFYMKYGFSTYDEIEKSKKELK